MPVPWSATDHTSCSRKRKAPKIISTIDPNNPDQTAAGGGTVTSTAGVAPQGDAGASAGTTGGAVSNQQEIDAAVGLAGRLSKALRDSVATGSVLMSMPVTERQAIETFCLRVENQRATINAIKQASQPPSRRNRTAGGGEGATKGAAKKSASKGK